MLRMMYAALVAITVFSGLVAIQAQSSERGAMQRARAVLAERLRSRNLECLPLPGEATRCVPVREVGFPTATIEQLHGLSVKSQARMPQGDPMRRQ